MLDRRDNVEPRHPNTCRWILELEEFKSWRSQPRGLLWIKGKPGAGKSTLMAFLYDKIRGSQDGAMGIQLDFFFTARGTVLQRTPLGMLRSLLNQIFDRDATVRSQLREDYRERCRQFGCGEREWEWPRVVLEQLLARSILTAATQQPVTVFVDALDEAGAASAAQLVKYFHGLKDQAEKVMACVKICISCRPYPIINHRAVEIKVDSHNHEDIAAYIRDNLPADIDLVNDLTKRAEGVFQWAHIVVPIVTRRIDEGDSLKDIRLQLKQVPVGLEEVYIYILGYVIAPERRAQSFLFFQWVCLAERPLTLSEMRYALATGNPEKKLPCVKWEVTSGFIETDEHMDRKTTALSGGLAEVTPSRDGSMVIQVAHQSINDFLRAKGLAFLAGLASEGMSPMDGEEVVLRSQAKLYRSCVVYIAAMDLLEVEHYELEEEFADLDDERKVKLLQDCPLVSYATVNLFVHAEKAARARPDAVPNEIHLLQQLFDQWVKAYWILEPYTESCPPAGSTLLHIAAVANLADVAENLAYNSQLVTEEDEYGATALYLAAIHGNVAVTQVLLGKVADVNAQCGECGSALQAASVNGNTEVVRVVLLDPNVDVNAQNGAYGSALQAASLDGNTEVVRMLLDADADVNAQGGEHGSALQAASWRGNTEVVRMLLDADADVNAEGGEHGSALQAASWRGTTDVTRMMLQDTYRNAQGREHGSALQSVPINGNTGLVRMLLDAGADVNAQGGEHGSALQAASWCGHAKVVRMLLDADADANAQGGWHGSALQAASWRGNTEVVRMLLDADADVNAQGGIYGSALQAASWRGDAKVVRMLLDADVDANAQGGEHGSALQAALLRGNTKIVLMLLEANVEVNAQGGNYGTPLLCAIHGDQSDHVQVLLDAGADASLSDDLGRTPLHVAASKNMLHILNRFPLLASTVNIRDNLFHTPLHIAVYDGYIAFAIELLKHGADPRIPDGYGKNSLDWAFGNPVLVNEMRKFCPIISITSTETQKLTVCQSICQISDLLLYSKPRFLWPLLEQLGRYLIFVGSLHNARFLLKLHLNPGDLDYTGKYKVTCGSCNKEIHGSRFVCRVCDHMDLCLSCFKRYPRHSRLHPDQAHELLEVPDNFYGDGQYRGSASKNLNNLLKHLLSQFGERSTRPLEMLSIGQLLN